MYSLFTIKLLLADGLLLAYLSQVYYMPVTVQGALFSLSLGCQIKAHMMTMASSYQRLQRRVGFQANDPESER